MSVLEERVVTLSNDLGGGFVWVHDGSHIGRSVRSRMSKDDIGVGRSDVLVELSASRFVMYQFRITEPH